MLLPGGFGTLDEAFELLTLRADRQGAARADRAARRPRRHVLAARGSSSSRRELVERGYISPEDLDARAASPTTSTSRSRRSPASTATTTRMRFVDGRPRAAHAARARRRAARARSTTSSPTSSSAARSRSIDATPDEIADDDHVDLDRIAFRFDRHGWARLRELIDRLNDRPDP